MRVDCKTEIEAETEVLRKKRGRQNLSRRPAVSNRPRRHGIQVRFFPVSASSAWIRLMMISRQTR